MEPLQLFLFGLSSSISLNSPGGFCIQVFIFILLSHLEHSLFHTKTGWLLLLEKNPHDFRGTWGLAVRVPYGDSFLPRPSLKKNKTMLHYRTFGRESEEFWQPIPDKRLMGMGLYLDGICSFKSQSVRNIRGLTNMKHKHGQRKHTHGFKVNQPSDPNKHDQRVSARACPSQVNTFISNTQKHPHWAHVQHIHTTATSDRNMRPDGSSVKEE